MIYFITDLHLSHYNAIYFTKNAVYAPWQKFKYSDEWKKELDSIKNEHYWNDNIIKHWTNELKDDKDAEVYIIGDLILGNMDSGFEALCQLGKLAKLHIIKGNHDQKLINALSNSHALDARYNYKDANIIPWKIYDCERPDNYVYNIAVDYAEISNSIHKSKLLDGKIILSHYPISEWNSPLVSAMFYGHVHNGRTSNTLYEIYKKGSFFKNSDELVSGIAINCGAMMQYMNWLPKTAEKLIEIYKGRFLYDK